MLGQCNILPKELTEVMTKINTAIDTVSTIMKDLIYTLRKTYHHRLNMCILGNVNNYLAYIIQDNIETTFTDDGGEFSMSELIRAIDIALEVKRSTSMSDI